MLEATQYGARGFSLISADGVETSLNGMDFLATEPSGLGINISNSISRDNFGSYLIGSELDPDDIQLEIVIQGHTRPIYQNFLYLMRQLRTAKITLKYEVPDVGTFFREVAVKSISKTEVDEETNAMLETLVLEPITYWYQILEFDFPDLIYYPENSGNASQNSLSFELSSWNIVPMNYKNEVRLYDFVVTSAYSGIKLKNPHLEYTHDSYSTGLDAYGIVIDDGDILRIGNLNDSVYSRLEGTTGTPDKYGSIANFQLPKCMAPIQIKDGENNIVVKFDMNSITRVNFKATVTVKQEFQIV